MLCRLYHVRLYQSHQNSARLRLPYSLKARLSVDIMWNSTNNFHSILVIFCTEAHREKTSVLLQPALCHVTRYCTNYRGITPSHLSASSMSSCAGVEVAFAIFITSYLNLWGQEKGERKRALHLSEVKWTTLQSFHTLYSVRHVGQTSLDNRQWCKTTAGSFMALIWMQFIPADGVWWEGEVALPGWLVLATAHFDASLCCRIWIIAVFVLHSVEVTQEGGKKERKWHVKTLFGSKKIFLWQKALSSLLLNLTAGFAFTDRIPERNVLLVNANIKPEI